MRPNNAPENYTIDDIESDGYQDMSVGIYDETEYRFIYLIKNFQGLYDLYVGPKSVEVVKSFLKGENIENDIDLSDLDDFFTELTDNSYDFVVEYDGIENLDKSLEGHVIYISSNNLIDNVRYSSINAWEENLKYQIALTECIKNLASQKELRIIYIEKTDRNSDGYLIDPHMRIVLAR